MKKTVEIESNLIAFLVDEELDDEVGSDGPGFYFECLKLSELVVRDAYSSCRRYVVSLDVNKDDIGGCPPDCWERSYESFTAAWNDFRDEVEKSKKFFGKVHLIENFASEYGWMYDDGSPRGSSATDGDYGPGNPWDAPGMSVSDFIKGVI